MCMCFSECANKDVRPDDDPMDTTATQHMPPQYRGVAKQNMSYVENSYSVELLTSKKLCEYLCTLFRHTHKQTFTELSLVPLLPLLLCCSVAAERKCERIPLSLEQVKVSKVRCRLYIEPENYRQLPPPIVPVRSGRRLAVTNTTSGWLYH